MLYTLTGILEICYQESADRIEGLHPYNLPRNQEEQAEAFRVKVRKQTFQVKPKAETHSRLPQGQFLKLWEAPASACSSLPEVGHLRAPPP